MATAKKAAPAAKPVKAATAKTSDKLAEKAAQAAKTTGGGESSYKPPEGWKAPKTLGLAADKLYETRQKRLALAKEVEALQAEETALKNHLIDNLPKSDSNGIAGKVCRVSVVKKDVARAEDWSKIYANIVSDYQKHAKKKDGMQDGAFALLQRRLGEGAVKEAWEAGKVVEGVGKFTVVDVSINKI